MVRGKNVSGVWKQFLAEVKPFVKPVLVVFGLILLGMLAVLRANFSYVDDLARTVEGYKGWGNFSRYLSNALAVVVYGNGTLTDISPWPQILAALVMAVAGVSLLYIIYGRKEFRWWELVVAVILAINPYFLQCLSYKFDAPFIAVAVLAMVVPFLARGQKGWVYIGAVLVGTLATCMTYQAALGILPMVMVVLVARMWNQGEKWGMIWRFGLRTIVGYGVGLLVFRMFLMRTVDAYVVTEVPGIGGLIPQVISNLKEYYRLVLSDFAGVWLGLVGVIVVGFVVMMTLNSKRRKGLAVLISGVTAGVLGVICFGIYVIMTRPLFEPRAMFGVCVMIELMAIVVVEERKWAAKWQKGVAGGLIAVAVGLTYLFEIFGFTYGNALALQKTWTEFRIEAVIDDLEEELKQDEVESVAVVGTVGLTPTIETAVETYPVLGRLVPVEFESGYWGQYQFFWYYGLRDLAGDMYTEPNVDDFPMVREFWYHNIRQREESGEIVVELK